MPVSKTTVVLPKIAYDGRVAKHVSGTLRVLWSVVTRLSELAGVIFSPSLKHIIIKRCLQSRKFKDPLFEPVFWSPLLCRHPAALHRACSQVAEIS